MEAAQELDADGVQHLPPLNAGLRLLDEAQRERVVIKEEKRDEEDERKIAHAFIEKQKDEIATLKEAKAGLQKTFEQKDEVIKKQAARIAELEAKTAPEPAAPAETAAPAEPAAPDERPAPDETRKRKLDFDDDAVTYRKSSNRVERAEARSNQKATLERFQKASDEVEDMVRRLAAGPAPGRELPEPMDLSFPAMVRSLQAYMTCPAPEPRLPSPPPSTAS